MKECNQCKKLLTLVNFDLNKRTKDEYDSRCKACKQLNYQNRRDKDPIHTYFIAKRSWCKQRDIQFTVTEQHLKEIWTDTCPVLRLPIALGRSGKGSHKSAHLDRFDPKKGYIEGNVAWISGRANRIKYDASLQELKQIVQWMERATTIPKGSTP